MTDLMIEVEDVHRDFPGVHALSGVSLSAARGTLLGLLGHNGAGKTTLVHILTTLLPPSSGAARVAGFDVVCHGHQVRSRIGVAGQFVSVDGQLSGIDNLILIARLLGASRREAKGRAEELLELFGLIGASRRMVNTYSGGMRRRLDLAASLVGHPEVIFLDEPTTGLDPASRSHLWTVIGQLVDDGSTALLTTQYLEEADSLADHIVVLSDGKVVASGTSAELKADVGRRAVHIMIAEEFRLTDASQALRKTGLIPADATGRSLVTPINHVNEVVRVIRALDEAGVGIAELSLSEPTLDDVYLALIRTPA